jgi:hypothetical protein
LHRKLRSQAERYGENVPAAGDVEADAGNPNAVVPRRFCWLNCVGSPKDDRNGEWSTDPNVFSGRCDPQIMDPPSMSASSTIVPLEVDASTALAVVIVGGDIFSAGVNVSGQLAFTIPAACRGPLGSGVTASCPARLTYLTLRSVGSMTIAAKQVSNMEIILPIPLDASVFTVDNVTTFGAPAGAKLFVSADIEGIGTSSKTYETSSSIVFAVDWNARKVNVLTVVSDETAASQLVLGLQGTIPNMLPRANAGPDQTVECVSTTGTPVTLSAVASSDPDGPGDLASFAWEWTTNGVHRTSMGPTLTTEVPFGTTLFSVEVSDRLKAGDRGSVAVNVVDTTPPTIAAPPNLVAEACDSAGAVVEPGTVAVNDACDTALSVDARVVDINGAAVNIPLVSGYRFRQGDTTIEYSAADSKGNRTTARQLVSLDRGPSCCPPGITRLVGTSGVDTLQGGNGKQCIAGLGGDDRISGGNNGDVLICGAGDDVCGGGNGVRSFTAGPATIRSTRATQRTLSSGADPAMT